MAHLRSFICVGAPRSGTTSLYRYLASHPEVVASAVKELNYFHKEDASLPGYRANFESCRGERVSLESSPSYFRDHENVAPVIASTLPDALLGFILREPAERLSAYYFGVKERTGVLREGTSFRLFADVVVGNASADKLCADVETAHRITSGRDVGAYALVLENYLEKFSPNQIHIMFTDDLASRPQWAMRGMSSFLKIDPGFYDDFQFARENVGLSVKNQAFYRALLAINSTLEPLVNRAPSVRVAGRRVHELINGKRRRQTPEDDKALELLRTYYLPSQIATAELLRKNFPETQLPTWLASVFQ